MEIGQDPEGALSVRIAEFKRRWRRKLGFDDVQELSAEVSAMLAEVIHTIDTQNTEKTSGNDNQNEQHYQNSKPDTYDFEPCLEKQEEPNQPTGFHQNDRTEPKEEGQGVTISLGLVLAACREIPLYADGEIRSWRDLDRKRVV